MGSFLRNPKGFTLVEVLVSEIEFLRILHPGILDSQLLNDPQFDPEIDVLGTVEPNEYSLFDNDSSQVLEYKINVDINGNVSGEQ